MTKEVKQLREALEAFVGHDTNDPEKIHRGQVYCWIPKETFTRARAVLTSGKCGP